MRSNAIRRLMTYGIPVILTMFLVLACKSKDFSERVKTAAADRESAASDAIKKTITSYVDALDTTLPSANVSERTRDQGKKTESRMYKWIVRATQHKHKFGNSAYLLPKLILKKANKPQYEHAQMRNAMLLGHNLARTLSEYWLRRPISESETVRVKLVEFLKLLDKYAPDGSPWGIIADFERLLPLVTRTYRVEASRGRYSVIAFTEVYQAAFNFPRKMVKDKDGTEDKEKYLPYRMRLCASLGDACRVPFEFQDIVVRRKLMDNILEKIAAYRKKHPKSGLERVLARFEKDIKVFKVKLVVPEEYPELASTISPLPTSPTSANYPHYPEYTVLSIGDKGAFLHADDPTNSRKRVKFELLGERVDWDLDDNKAREFRRNLTKFLSRIGDNAASTMYVHIQKNVPMKITRLISKSFGDTEVRYLDLVGRRRLDDSLRYRRNDGTVVDKSERKTVAVRGPAGSWKCQSIMGLRHLSPAAEHIKGYVMVSNDEVVAGPGTTAEITVPLTSGRVALSRIGKWISTFEKPVMLAVKSDVTQAQFHKVLNGVTWKCTDDECKKPVSIPKTTPMLLAVCN